MHLNMHVHTTINKCNNENKKYKIELTYKFYIIYYTDSIKKT